MRDLGSNLLTRYGIWTVVVAAILAVGIWALAHFASAPRTPVKILWGLVEYTTSPSRQEQTPVEPPTPTAPIAKTPAVDSANPAPTQSQLNPRLLTLEVSHGLTPDGYIEVIAALRSRHVLRELRPLESDRPIDSSPPGTFFFIYAGGNFRISTNSSCHIEILHRRASRLQSSSSRYFEVHRRGNRQLLLLVYASESDADRIRTLSGDREFQVTIFPRPWGTVSSLIELPFERITLCNNRELQIDEDEEIYILDVILR